MLPKRWHAVVNDATRKSIETALDVALWTMDHRHAQAPSNWWHKLAVGTTGAAGGVFGLPALGIELPVSTTIMLRSIADIARILHLSEGTVRNHLSAAIGKTGGRNRADAARIAEENGWL